jgi:hypothetical protein
MPIITICSSANFYRQVVEAAAELEKLGYQTIIPITAERMKQTGDYEVDHYRTWLKDASDYHKKTALMRQHFDEVEKGDAILVVNGEKHGTTNYIGGNVLMEMTIAFHLKKPIFILNELPEESNYLEELIGMEPIILHSKLQDLPKSLPLK